MKKNDLFVQTKIKLAQQTLIGGPYKIDLIQSLLPENSITVAR